MVFYQKREYIVEGTNQVIDLNIKYLWNFIQSHFNQNSFSYILLIVAFILVFVNWGGEVVKWKLMIGKILPVNNKLATVSILSGVAGSFFTPFKIGGYFGRIAHLPFNIRTKAITLILLGDIAQFISTLFCGTLSIMILILKSPTGFTISDQKMYLIPLSILMFLFSISSILIFTNLQKLITIIDKIKFLKKWTEFLQIISEIDHQKATKKVLLISFIRFSAISIQYYLVFNFFGLKLSFSESILMINAMFFIYNFLPTFNIIEFGITKSAIVLFLIQTFIIQGPIALDITLLVSCSSFLIWLINLVIPSAIGSYFLLKTKLLNDKE